MFREKNYTFAQLKRENMKAGNIYDFNVVPQDVDFTLRSRLTAMCGNLLNVAGHDAHRNGFGTDAVMRDNNSWVLSRMAIEFDYMPKQYDEYKIRTWIVDSGRIISVRNFVITNGEGEPLGRATSQWCMINLSTRRPSDLTPVLESCRQFVFDEPTPCEAPRKLGAVETETAIEHRIVYSDIDFNSHVNTLRYIEMMVDALPVEVVAEPHKIRLDIHFVKESRYGQSLTIGYRCEEGKWLFEIKDNDGAVICRASFEVR